MNMLPILLLLRFKQLLRALIELGLVRSIILIAIIMFALLNLNAFIIDKPWVAAGVLISVILSNHISRRDKDFLFKIAKTPWVIYLVEYVVISLPFLFILIKNAYWFEGLVLSVLVILVPFTGNILRLENKLPVNSFSFFPLCAFEWRSGLRKDGFLIILVYLIAIIFAQYSSAIPIALLLLAIINTSFYLECEPRQMVELYALSPKEFLNLKIANQLVLFWVPCVPLLLIFIILIPEYWYVDVIMIVVCSTVQILAIVLKYNSYIPKERLGMNSLIIALCIVCFMIPFLSPIPFILIIRNYRKAIKTLNEYLHA